MRRALNHAKPAAGVRRAAPGAKTMTNFDTDTLSALRDVPEVLIQTDRHPRSALVIWGVVVDDEVFVRGAATKGDGTGISRRAAPPR
jgi:hypothetical protein